jgi:lipopolysaccharide export system protein LptA
MQLRAFATALALSLAFLPYVTRAQEAKPAAVEEKKSAGDAAERLGLRFTPNAELVITSDEAEGSKTEKGQESVIFSKNVRASQGDMNLACDWLEAVYPESAGGRPDRITARGSVVINQGTNQARCSEASVDNVACTAECKSVGTRATLRRGSDDVEANAIYFDLCKGTVRAVGDVLIRVRERPGEKPSDDKAQKPGEPPEAPKPATPAPGGA